ncbi:sulfur oxidation c-type cytochrome SoxX [Amylibacter sp.]|jgi:sulfur-oxidizing protein SoxX|nr:sulfur oxidation c-type cytochrome SoxX [Amylibacter sp.]MDC3300495.1 sulfur oxidation c-type cytochrome SoxX [bacterium]MDA9074742.1 sulfur oxidation c-type cytochrome SoxX [Amylibacter sp.]MDA9178723.1 sulfur oxidation c-type cytochrome SoxX [Amylibacter sp.]MDA9242885.1 sulfur oxidation c-type cytochrome SoxX [Amylibacter sp.]|tara:strand:+ start:436 stop:894 length:459 start_codon:yes stop_codon:yes gene_type:complete
MLLRSFIAVTATLISTSVIAGDISPTDVSFGDYGEISASLTGVAGDPVAGKKVSTNRKLGNCLACHVNDDASSQSFHGEVGPELNGAGSRWSEEELRGIVTNSKNTFEGTIMPAFYSTENGVRTLKKFVGKTILSAQQVEDVVAYILTLKEE